MFRWESVYILRFLKHGMFFYDRNFITEMKEITSILLCFFVILLYMNNIVLIPSMNYISFLNLDLFLKTVFCTIWYHMIKHFKCHFHHNYNHYNDNDSYNNIIIIIIIYNNNKNNNNNNSNDDNNKNNKDNNNHNKYIYFWHNYK